MHSPARVSLFVATLALMTAAAQPAAAEGLVLKFHETQTITSMTPNKYQMPGKKMQMTTDTATVDNHYVVTLAPDSLSIAVGDNTDLYDFATKRYYRIQNDKKTFSSYPLHALPLYRHALKERTVPDAVNYETVTQTAIFVKVPTGITQDLNPISLDLDSIYGSVSDTTTSDIITAATANGKTAFTSKYGALASFGLSDTAVPEPLQKTYARFLSYGPLLHPKVETAMNSGAKVFAALDYAINNHQGKKIASTWALEGTAPAAEAPKLPTGYTQVYNADADINGAFVTSQQPGPTADNFAVRIQGYVAQSDSMHAVLSLQEMFDSLPKELTDQKKYLTDQVLRAANELETQKVQQILTIPQITLAAAQKAQETLKAAKPRAKDYGYFLDIYRARAIRQELRLTKMDDKRFTLSVLMDSNALVANPWLATAYADLGDAQFEAADGLFAWTCWNKPCA